MTEHHSSDDRQSASRALAAASHVHSHFHEGRLEASYPADELDGLPHRAAIRPNSTTRRSATAAPPSPPRISPAMRPT